jgi:hypothetical protein
MKRNLLPPLFLLTVIVWLSSCTVVQKEEISVQDSQHRIEIENFFSEDKLMTTIEKLTSENYAGRLSGTPEYRACARWMASLFQEWGLRPAGDNGSFLQSFHCPYTLVFVGGKLAYNYRSQGRWREKRYIYEKEYYPGSHSGNGELTAEVVYVGYGIRAPEIGYNDYDGVDVNGKIVLVEPGIPISPEKNPDLFKVWAPLSSARLKAKMAVAHGAKGILFNELRVNPDTEPIKDFMAAQIGENAVKDIFSGTGKTQPEVIESIKSSLQPQSFKTGKSFTIDNFTEYHADGTGYSVLGWIEGTDPELKEEVIILGAHLDGAGFCYEILPGANDNASGIAVLLAVAESLAKGQSELGRSVLFIGIGSKEQSFRGSLAYLENPSFPVEKTLVFINLDSIGCGDSLEASISQDSPEIWDVFFQANENTTQRELKMIPYSNLDMPQTDAEIFAKKKIPAISFRAYGTPTYPYTTKDTASSLTPDIMKDMGRILFLSIFNLANSKKISLN